MSECQGVHPDYPTVVCNKRMGNHRQHSGLSRIATATLGVNDHRYDEVYIDWPNDSYAERKEDRVEWKTRRKPDKPKFGKEARQIAARIRGET